MVLKRLVVGAAAVVVATLVLAGCPNNSEPSTACGVNEQGRTPVACNDHGDLTDDDRNKD